MQMAGNMDHPSRRKSSQAPIYNVNLYCAQCDSQVGIFDNEWIRLTSSYARSKEKGTHIGTEVGQRTHVVPYGIAQKSAEGCVMADVFCKKCSAIIGQYCKSAPNVEKQHLVDQYFYKLSRTYLKDSHTSLRVEPQFGYGSDIARSSGRTSLKTQYSTDLGPRWSETPQRQTHTPSLTTSLAPAHSMNTGTYPLKPENNTKTPFPNPAVPNLTGNFRDSSTGSTFESDSGFARLSTQMATLQTTVDELKLAVRKLQTDRIIPHATSNESHDPISQFEAVIRAMRVATTNAEELELLRIENKTMKARLNTIATAMGTATNHMAAEGENTSSRNSSVEDAMVLGKRKRQKHDTEIRSLRQEANTLQMEADTQRLLGNLQQFPTPRSTDLSNSSSQVSQTQDPIEQSLTESEIREAEISPIEDIGLPTASSANAETPAEHQDHNNLDATSNKEHEPHQIQSPRNSPSNVEFSDEEALPENCMSLHSNRKSTIPEGLMVNQCNDSDLAGSFDELPDSQDSDVEAGHMDESNTQRPGFTRRRQANRRVTESVIDQHARSMAPEPIPRRRTLANRLKASSLDRAEIYTPETIAKKVREKGKPREPKRHLQTTEKLLNLELKELGLTEWIGKDKRSSEYRNAVTAARARQREANKLNQLSGKGFIPPPILPYVMQSDQENALTEVSPHLAIPMTVEQSQPAVEMTPTVPPQPLSDVTNQPGKMPVTTVAKSNDQDERMMTRKQQREEIRKRDQMAKEAMEREEVI